MKRIFLTCASCLLTLAATAQLKVSVLGDSYSTYQGYVTPETNLCWYAGTDGGEEKENDVNSVQQTWWYQLIDGKEYQLERNNSYSGSTICHTGYDNKDYSDRSFITRMDNIGQPDIILVFGGTNDSWAKVPIGEFQYAGWTRADLYHFRPAFAYLLDYLTRQHPKARILNLTNTELSPEVTESMDEICRHYNVENLRLHDIDKQWGHPSIKGMKSIRQQVKAFLDHKTN